MFKNNLIFAEGPRILYFSLIFMAIFLLLGFYYLLFINIIFLLFCFYFFRNPDRDIKSDIKNVDNILISPSDGIIVYLGDVKNINNKNNNNFRIDTQLDIGDNTGEFTKKIAIFLSPLDVHVNWVPVTGKILEVKYCPGEFRFAFVEKSSELNEHNDIIIESNIFNNNKYKRKVLVRQIAGTIARKIVCWKKSGDNIFRGEKYGMIKFGSRIEIFLDNDFAFNVTLGQRVYGGVTVLGKYK